MVPKVFEPLKVDCILYSHVFAWVVFVVCVAHVFCKSLGWDGFCGCRLSQESSYVYYIFLKFLENIQRCMGIGGTPLIDISTLLHGC